MEKLGHKLENNHATLEAEQPPSSGQAQPAEEPIELKRIFPDAQQDLDALFPDPKMKALLKEIVENRKRNERFVKRIKIEVGAEKEEIEDIK